MEIVGILLVVILVIAGIWLWSSYNRLIRLRNIVQESWKQIDVELQRRYDLIPNLVRIVQGAADFEQSTLQKVTEARTAALAVANGSPAERQGPENMLTGALKNLFAVAEAYPQLTAVAAFRDLQAQVTTTEDRLAASRRFYQSNVRDFNTSIQSFPTNLIAGSFHFTEAEYFEIASPEIATNPFIEFPPQA